MSILENTILTFQGYSWVENLNPNTTILNLEIQDDDMNNLIYELGVDNNIEFADEEIASIKSLKTIKEVVEFIKNKKNTM